MISNKLIGLAALAFLCGSAGFTAVGCSSTEVTESDDDDDDGGAGASSSGTTPRPRPDSGDVSSSSGGVAGPACYDQNLGLQLNDPIPGRSTGACTTAKIDQFWELIFEPSDAEADAAAAEQDTYFNENPACVTCLIGPGDWDGDGSYTPPTDAKSPVLVLQQTTAYLNTGACTAAAAGVDAACGVAVINQTLCVSTSCQDCESEADNVSCQDAALAEGQFCGDVEVPEGCAEAVTGAQAAITAACAGGEPGFEGAFKRNAAYLCN